MSIKSRREDMGVSLRDNLLTSIPLLNTAGANFSSFLATTSLTSIPLLNTANGSNFLRDNRLTIELTEDQKKVWEESEEGIIEKQYREMPWLKNYCAELVGKYKR